MSDFITLACPNCASQLRVAPESASLICPSCGREYLLRGDAGNVMLEGHARCPRCGRNDQVRAASAIVREGDDCAFIPGENQDVPLALVREYLYR